jgi:flagellar biosynthetic protein FliP
VKTRTILVAALAAAILAIFAVAPAVAQSLNLDLGDGTDTGALTGRIIQLIALITILSLAPSILVMVTSFTRIIVVLSLMRNAIGTQQTPPNAVLVSLALFLTAFIMAPTFEKAYTDGIAPLINEDIDEVQAFERGVAPFKTFMLGQVREKDLRFFMDLSGIDSVDQPDDTPLQVLVPAFMISELKRAFEIGFLVFVPFIIIDMVIASVLMAMGMMMLPPVMIALPFKLIFFVLVDGWSLIAGSLVQSFGTG